MKLKIKISNGKLRRIVIFGIPIFEYGIENGKNFSKFLLFDKFAQKEQEDVFYLKVNKAEGYALPFLSHWVSIIPENAKIFIIVDDKRIQEKIIKKIEFKNRKVYFIKSVRNNKLKRFLKNAKFDKSWYNAACAHLTTFYHSQKHNIRTFWNIDADDTLMCLEPQKAYSCLQKVSNYAKEKNIDAFSLDFYYSRGAGKFNHWSFGVTHIINNKTLDYLLSFACPDWFEMFEGIKPRNFDWYMNYIKATLKDYKICAYSINNLLFLHDTAFFSAGWLSFMQYKNDVIEYPIFKKFYELNDIGLAYVPLHNDIIKFDLNVGEREGLEFLHKKFVNKDIHYTFVNAVKNINK